MIRDFKPRLYQETILATCTLKNTLVVLPTGLGKTYIFLLLAAQRLKQYPESKILLLGPTRPLIHQYYQVFERHTDIDTDKMAEFTGYVRPEKRTVLWNDSQVIFSTPQGLENDLISSKIKLEDVSLLGFDEAHRAVGNYAYAWIAKRYMETAKFPRVIGLTASPGSTVERVAEVCRNLYIEEIEARTEQDSDVSLYIQEIDIKWVRVDLPEEFSQIRKYLEECYLLRLKTLRDNGYISGRLKSVTKRELLDLQSRMHAQLAKGSRDFRMMQAVSVAAEAMKVQHALELIETQGLSPLREYLHKLEIQARTTKVKAVKRLVRDLNFRSAKILADKLSEQEIEHPKIKELRNIVEQQISGKKKAIVFTQYRDSALKIARELNRLENIKARIFVGQARKKETGLSQKEQRALLKEFEAGNFNILVATSVGEEGLDIPRVNLVVFYEPIPSAIRTIQRRGRTGRQEKGSVVVLITKGTRDEAYHWVARRKERKMHRILKTIRTIIQKSPEMQDQRDFTLSRFIKSPELKIYVDYREKGSDVTRELLESKIDIQLTLLESADYLVSSRVGVELKTVRDFVDSLLDGRLLSQIRTLKQSFERPLVIIEGSEDIYAVRNVHPNAIRGLLATIAVSYGVPILFSRNPQETASFLTVLAKREQGAEGSDFSPHASKKPTTLREQQEYMISAIPGIGPAIARPLLKRFGSVKDVINADEEELQNVEKIGKKKAKQIKDFVDSGYKEFD